jgi:hypothetical protein
MATLPSSFDGDPDDWEREELRRPGAD